MKTKKNTAFYIETVALLLLLLFGISVLVQVFGKAQQMGREAKELAIAVPLARNAAEAFTACDNALQIAQLLGDEAYSQQDSLVMAFYDENGKPAAAQQAYFTLSMAITQGQPNLLAEIKITRNLKEIYTLNTEKYVKRG